MVDRTDSAMKAQDAQQIDLARRPDLSLGNAAIRPSLRTIFADAGEVVVEPRVMQVLLALNDAGGAVLPRDALMESCWKGVIVGDDAINRAIGELRRALRDAGADVEVETIARVGYRLKGGESQWPAAATIAGAHPVPARRTIIFGGAGAVVLGAAGIGAWMLRGRDNPRVRQLVEQSRQALREELPDRNAQGRGFLQEAVAIEPENSEAWGLLALAWRNVAENASPADVSPAVRACERAARRALALDRRDGNALSALAALQPFFGDWLAAERRFQDVLKVAPDALPALSHLTTLYQSSGQLLKSRQFNRRAIELDPLSPVFQFREALKDWIFGAVAEADARIDRALQLWPRHPGVWNARLMLFAYTARPRAALAMLADASTRPSDLSAAAIEIWRLSLEALDDPMPHRIAAAQRANRQASTQSPGLAINAIMVLASLGDVDSAFEIAQGFFLRRGPLIGRAWTGAGQLPVNDQRWRRSMFLFTPATLAMRTDARFGALCSGMGLSRYWHDAAIVPDFKEIDGKSLVR